MVVLALFQLMFHVVYLDFYLTFSKFWVFQVNWSLLLHFYINFSEILEKASFVQMFKWTNLLDPLHESAVIGQSTYEYDLDNFMNELQIHQIFLDFHMLCKTCH